MRSMNSVTPIVSLIGTMQEIVQHDIQASEEQVEAVDDLERSRWRPSRAAARAS